MYFKQWKNHAFCALKWLCCLLCLTFSPGLSTNAQAKTIPRITPNPEQLLNALDQMNRAVKNKNPHLFQEHLLPEIVFLSFLPKSTIQKTVQAHELAQVWTKKTRALPPNPFQGKVLISKRIIMWDTTKKGEIRLRVKLLGPGPSMAPNSEKQVLIPLIWDLIFKLEQGKARLGAVHPMPKDVYSKIVTPILKQAQIPQNYSPGKIVATYTREINNLPELKTSPKLLQRNQDTRLQPGGGIIRHGSVESGTN
ncbi:hypothetical protein [Dethiosulfatarculus sandiegensis]|uniref:Uncharacterized protein n=1 Tax=Dethiosulfatarculus sandiegensis TaxID=1429043 RepID=A0A0D2K0H3_9BACT|nr:hypothetical protein [Dethiosulfatarculus sandiegensis]KIX15240.1 hypothetical protein X474_05445 [Dethiosulfatarculus sandiegensis]